MKQKKQRRSGLDIKMLGQMFKDIYSVSKGYLPFACVQIIISALVPLVNVVIPKVIIDAVLESDSVHAVMAVLIMFAVNAINSIANQAFTYYFEVRNRMLKKHCEKLLMEKIMRVEYETLELAGTHEQKVEARRGIDNMLQIIENVRTILSNIITLVCATYLISYLNILIALLIFAVVLFNAYCNYKRVQYDIDRERRFADLDRRWSYLNYICRDSANAKEIRFHHLSRWLSEKISRFTQEHQVVIRDSFHNNSVTRRLAAFSYMIQRGIIYIYVGLQLWEKRITAGEFTQYIAAVELVSTKLVSIISALLDINKNKYVIEKYYEFLQLEDDTMQDRPSAVPEPPERNGIEIRDVWFRYSEDSAYVLKGLSLNIQAGERLSVVGRNGCGKTTLIKLLLRICQPEKGQILLNGTDIYAYDYESYCRLFSVIFQDFKIFSFTILDNIMMEDMPSDPDGAALSREQQEKVDMAVAKANLMPVIEKFPAGINTYINKDYVSEGYGLSGGMQQTLAMSRAYYRDARHIILDEPTAMMDPVSEARIYENFNQLIGSKSAVYISHRMSSSRFCDRIAYIDDGIVKEYGTHEELMQLNGLYAVLFKTQAELFAEVKR